MYKLLPILLFAYGLAVTTDDIYDNSYALIIGIDKYENVPNLDYAVSDANSIASLLKDNFNFPSKNVKVLLNNEATYLNIRESLDEISSLAKENDRVLIFFAGHGLTNDLPGGGEMGYILPIDGKRDKLFATSIPMEDMKRISSMSQSKHMLFLIDACYGGLAATGARGLSSTTPNFIDKITSDKSRQIITAGGRGEQVIEKSEWGHSAFTMNLIRGLKNGKADFNGDGYITADELGLFLKDKVSIDSGNQQTPQSRRYTSQEGEFVFVYSENTVVIQDESADAKLDAVLSKLDKVEKQTADKTIIDEKIEDAEDKQSINKYKYQITASTTLKNLAIDKKSERKFIGGGLLAGSGVLFSLPLLINLGHHTAEQALIGSGVIVGGIGILVLLIKDKVEKKYDSIKDIDNQDEKEELAYNHLVYLADEAKRGRQYAMVTFGALSAYSLLGGTTNQYTDAKYNNQNLYNGLFNGALAWYHYKVLSKEEKALENYSNQP